MSDLLWTPQDEEVEVEKEVGRVNYAVAVEVRPGISAGEEVKVGEEVVGINNAIASDVGGTGHAHDGEESAVELEASCGGVLGPHRAVR